MPACQRCGASLETPLACQACGSPFDVPEDLSPFAVLGLEPAFEVDEKALKRRLLQVSRLVHPDYFGTAEPEVRGAAERASARLNDAYEVLSDAFRRADWLVGELGGPSEAEERQMPQAFLMEVLEWNETLEEARDGGPESPAWAALDSLEAELSEQRQGTMGGVAAALTPLPEHGSEALAETRRQLNAIRYLDRSLGQIRTMRLAQPRSV